MKVTAYDWVNNLRESIPARNLGLSKKVQKKFNDTDAVENSSYVNSDTFLSVFKKAVDEFADEIEYQVDSVQADYREKYAGEDAGILILLSSNIENSDDWIQFGIFVGNFSNVIICWPFISTIENLNDTWHRKSERKVLYLKGKKKVKDLFYAKKDQTSGKYWRDEYNDCMDHLINVSFGNDKIQDFLKAHYIDGMGFAGFQYFILDNIDEFVYVVKKCTDIVKDMVTIKNFDMQYKQAIANKINSDFEIQE